jgi:hypothetical protein
MCASLECCDRTRNRVNIDADHIGAKAQRFDNRRASANEGITQGNARKVETLSVASPKLVDAFRLTPDQQAPNSRP